MRKYTSDIHKLYESVGYEKIESGKTYTSSKGDKITVKNIFIDATTEIPEVYVEYEAELVNGEKISETNRFGILVDMIRSK